MKGKLAPDIEALSDVLAALGKVSTDDEKRWVLETAANRLSLATPTLNDPKKLGSGSSVKPASFNDKPKEFMRVKAPDNDVQRVACLAFYLTHARETELFKTINLTKLNTEAAGPKVNMARAASNALYQNRYLAPAGGGKKQITSLGEDVVNALPDQEAVKAAELRNGKQKRRKRKDKGKTEKK